MPLQVILKPFILHFSTWVINSKSKKKNGEAMLDNRPIKVHTRIFLVLS